jgi:hypothetical protein
VDRKTIGTIGLANAGNGAVERRRVAILDCRRPARSENAYTLRPATRSLRS